MSLTDQPAKYRDNLRGQHIPLWRRITAAFTLLMMVALGGLVLAAIIGTTALLMLFVLERAIAG